MKKVINGYGNNVTSTVQAWLKSKTSVFYFAHLYLIGEADDPKALRLTDWQTPLLYSLYGTFLPAIIERGAVRTKIGFDISTLDIKWRPEQIAYTPNLANAGPYQLASISYYRDWPIRVWTCYMPTPGDANTYGCSELFGGRIGPLDVQRGEISFTANSFLDVVNMKIPSGVITITNTLAPTKGVTPPVGFSSIPQFNIVAGSTNTTLICSCITDPGHIFADNALLNGFLVFNKAAGATLGGQWSTIESNVSVDISGTDYNQIQLFKRLPFAPTPGSDTLYISGAAPVNLADGDYYGFPFVPNPETAA
jgi:hypothetical protein